MEPVRLTHGDPMTSRASFLMRSVCRPASAVDRIKWREISFFMCLLFFRIKLSFPFGGAVEFSLGWSD